MSMNKKIRSLINTRYEAQRIYYQRREIKKKDQQIQELTNNWRLLEEVIKDMLFTTPHEDQMLNFILGKMKEIEEDKI